MADFISFEELRLKMDQLKEKVTTDLNNSKLAYIYCGVIDEFLLFCKQESSYMPVDNVPKYYEQVTGVSPYIRPSTECKKRKARAVLFIRDTLNGCDLARRYIYHSTSIPETFQKDIQLYEEWLVSKECSRSTIRTRIGRLKPFFIFIFENGCSSIDSLDPQTFVNFIGTLDGHYSSTGKTNILYTIKSYFSCPMISSNLKFRFDSFLENLHTNKHERLESAYSAEEIRKVLDSVDRASGQGKMLYLMMLLASVYGLRSSDIRTLQLSNVDWKKQCIKLSQQKTKRYLELPLIQEVCLALLDYIKNSRPQTIDDYIFIRQKPPHVPYADDNHFSQKVRAFFKKAGINTDRKHAGLHSMRHSLATGMMLDGVQISEIATILGHTSPQTTTRYIWSDISQLRKASMEVMTYAE
ncbi:tyrosine-type recombinase/integrase [Neobacillus sp. OS1-2]|uniref:tyrosine-type recombinase/integrase n=1 Tax=Neobacillus sp. OS1-2 TaxID=3070680 RepID=UPI0027DF48FC|nr:tyrosine-type recombinase/integrase [Neobacillus sp. OS1-2]WML37976.1 tyrosine-type recombinase/integrase [Neobacillus sp. OS1-2]WML39531.1 tyrosine-type recombinase/integrase [Neobacillus sp. OS1-2]